MRPPFDIAADLDTPVSAFLKLGPLRPRYLLESVEGGERLARYSFLGFGEAHDVRLGADALTIDGASTPVSDGPSRLDALRKALAKAPRPGPHVDGLKLLGGLVGAVNYDFVRRLENLPARTPDEPEAAFVACRSLLVFDHVSRRVAMLHDGTDAERDTLSREVRALLAGPVPQVKAGRRSEAVPSLTRAQYCDVVERAREHITAGDVFQLVAAVRFEGETDLPPFTVYRALRSLNPSPYSFFLDLGDRQVVGSSPEALVRLEAGEATLRPIAGTRRRGANEAEDKALELELLADPKEAAEHVMLVDLARNDLGRVAQTGSVRVEPFRVVERYSHVMHIVSGVRGRLAPGYDQFDLFAAAFPAGTVTGAPKVRAMQIIDELEPTGRGLYAGTVGYFGADGDMDQAIAIRTIELANGRYAVQAGAGVVADSVPEREHDEVLQKSRALMAALERAETGL